MLSLALNPGLFFFAAALITPLLARAARKPFGLLCAFLALVLPFAGQFGPMGEVERLGVAFTPLLLDPLSQLTGLAGALCALACWLAFGGEAGARLRDSAFLTLAGGALGAVFAGDLISFTVMLECASLALAALVFSSSGAAARAAASSVLAWHSGAGAAAALGVGALWAGGGAPLIGQVPGRDAASLLLLAGLLIKLGAMPGHLWLRAAAAQASPLALPAMLGLGLLAPVYGLARCFAGEPGLLYLALGMGAYAAVQAPFARNRGELAAWAAIGGLAPVVLAIGLGGEAASAAAGALLFVAAPSVTLMLLRGPEPGALLPLLLCGVGAGSMLALPGFAGFAPLELLLGALGARGLWWAWLAVFLAPVAAVVHLARLPLVSPPAYAASGGQLLAQTGLAAVLLTAGLAPELLLALTPPQGAVFSGFQPGAMLARCEAVLVGLAVSALARTTGLYPKALPRRTSDPFAWLFLVRLGREKANAAGSWPNLGEARRLTLSLTKAFERFPNAAAKAELAAITPVLVALLIALGVWMV